MSEVLVVLLGGLPASGKSSICEELLRLSAGADGYHVEILRFDEIELDIMTKSGKSVWSEDLWHCARDEVLARAEATLDTLGVSAGKSDCIAILHEKNARDESGGTLDAIPMVGTGTVSCAAESAAKDAVVGRGKCRSDNITFSIKHPDSAFGHLVDDNSTPTTTIKAGAPSRKSILIIEDTFEYDSMRRPYRRLARSKGAAFCFVEVRLGASECLARNAVRASVVTSETILRLAERFEHIGTFCSSNLLDAKDTHAPLICDTGHACTVVLDGRRPVLENACFVWEGWRSCRWAPLSAGTSTSDHIRAVDRQATAANIVHQVDLVLRRWVGDVVRAAGETASTEFEGKPQQAEHISNAAKLANVARRQCLSACKAWLQSPSIDIDAEPADGSECGSDVIPTVIMHRLRDTFHTLATR